MAEAALLGLATNAAMAMGQLIQARAVDEMKLAWGLKDELEKLKTKFSDLQAFLKDVGSAKHADKRSQVNDWLQKVKDAAYFADDIMDDYDYEILRRELEQNKRFIKQFGAFFTRYNPIIFRIRMSHKVSNALAMFDELDKKAHTIGLKQVDITRDGIGGTWADDGSLSLSQARQLAAADAAEFVGRKDDEEKLLQMLCHPTHHEHNICIVAIVGLGGLGKTTFARRLYESDQVHAHFEKRLWICVSENFTIPRILNEMVELVTSKKGDLSNIDAIIKKLQESLKNNKYLLVLDDVWCTDQELWNSLKNTLQRIGGLPGSVILATTRINEVATSSRAVSTHFLKGLSKQESWELLKQKAFAGASSLDVSSLEEVGKRIASKCEGVPLAIKAIGGILQLKQYPHEWEAIEKSDVWDLPQNDQNQILPSLRLSFNHLPSSALKLCFAYCAVFLKDYYLEKDELVNIWLAQGFLHESKTRNLTMEETGEEYLKVLQNYSLLEVMADDDDEDDDDDDDDDDNDDEDEDDDDDEEDDDDDDSSDDDSDGDELRYTMHDLVHDLAVDSLGEDLLLWKPKDHHKIDNCRHLVIDPQFVEALSQLPITKTLRKLRTITYGFPPNVLAHAKYLRTLLVDDQGIKEVPPSIGLLKHLRYFSVSHNPIKTLPDSIGKLYLLQTLRLLDCGSMEVLPKVLYRLVKLIHIPTTTSMLASRGLLQLTELQTLPHLALGDDDDDGWSIDELGRLHKLTGEIHISGLERVKTKENAKEADLAGKAKVSKITLAWAKDREEISGGNCDEDVLDGLQPHPNITSLELQNFYGQMFPSWIMRMALVTKEGSISTPLKNLTSFKLLNCSRCKTFPTLGQLPFLKYLTLNGLRVECIGNDFYVTSINQSNRNVNQVPFPSLIELEISDCQVLKTWVLPPSELAPTVLPRLEVLRVTGCPKLKTLPALDFQFLRKLVLEDLGIQSLDITKHSSLFTSPKVNLMLETLKISKCEKLVSIPSELQYVASLKTIRVLDCPALVSLPDDMFHGLSFLSKLSISKCEMLSNIPNSLEECLSLKRLKVNHCPSIKGPTPDFRKLKSLRELCKSGNSINLMNSMLEAIRHLPHLLILATGRFKDEDEQNTYFSDLSSIQQSQSLTELYLDGHPNVKFLPEQLQLLTGIKILVIRNYDNLEQFPEWVARLSSLEELWLGRCKNLKYLPSKEAFLQLFRLKELQIWKCPVLAERCHKDDGPEWSKISHIPHIEIDDKIVQNLS